MYLLDNHGNVDVEANPASYRLKAQIDTLSGGECSTRVRYRWLGQMKNVVIEAQLSHLPANESQPRSRPAARKGTSLRCSIDRKNPVGVSGSRRTASRPYRA